MPKNVFFFLFLLIWFIPPFTKFFNWDYYTFSTVCCVLLFSVIHLIFRKHNSFKKYIFRYFGTLIILLALNIILTSLLFSEEYDVPRSLVSTIFLLVFFFGAYLLSEDFLLIEKKSVDIFFRRLMYFYFGIIILSFFTSSLFTIYSKPIFPYSEPSHMALFFGPILCYNIITSQSSRKRLYLILIGLAISIFVKNLTLLVTIIVVAVFIFNIYVIPIAVLGGVFFYYFSDIEYFMSRLDFANSRFTNLSTMVYVKGYELIQQSFEKSYGLGIGFQQLGIVTLQTETQQALIKILGEDLNAKDGGFLSAKFISEFGIIGVFFIFLYIVSLSRSWIRFKKISISDITSGQALYYSSFITFFSELFFRSLGYFTPSVFLFLVAIFVRKHEKEN